MNKLKEAINLLEKQRQYLKEMNSLGLLGENEYIHKSNQISSTQIMLSKLIGDKNSDTNTKKFYCAETQRTGYTCETQCCACKKADGFTVLPNEDMEDRFNKSMEEHAKKLNLVKMPELTNDKRIEIFRAGEYYSNGFLDCYHWIKNKINK